MGIERGTPDPERAARNAVRDGLGVFALIAFGFALYAYVAPATYRATATVEIHAERAGSESWPSPPQAAARLRVGLLDPALLRRIAHDQHPAPPDTERLLAARIAESLSVESHDAHHFEVSAAAADATPAQRIANELARAAVGEGASILGTPSVPAPSVRAAFVAAPFPSNPVRPNRLLVVLVGLTVGSVWGAGITIGLNLWAVRRARPKKGSSGAARAPATDREHDASSPLPVVTGELDRQLAEMLWPARVPVSPARISAQPVGAGWAPARNVAAASRSALCEELMPFLAEGSLVAGVTAVPERYADKAILASELALALAEAGNLRVLLVDADFHAPEVHRAMRLDMSASSGFSQQLRARVHGSADVLWHVIDCGRSLHVMAEGAMRAPGMVLSTQFEQAIRSLRTYYDAIVINGPLTSSELDCRALGAVLDGVVLASPRGGSPLLAHALELFDGKRFKKTVEI